MDTEAFSSSIYKFFRLIHKILIAYIEAISNIFNKVSRKSIKGQNVLITGAAHGLGRELALKFADEGANLALIDINELNNKAVEDEINKKFSRKGIRVQSYCIDITDEENVKRLHKQVKQELGDIDILVNNAGIVQCLPILEASSSGIERTFRVNTLAHFWTIRQFIPSMLKRKSGHIVAVSSIAGLIGNKYLTDYCASKFAIVGLMDALDKEIHDEDYNSDIHLTTICPVSMTTGMFKSFTSRFSWLLPVMSAEQVAESALDAILRNKRRVVTPQIAHVFYQLQSLIPTKVNLLVQNYLNYGVKPHNN